MFSEYAEDISPYATFHVQGQGQGHKMSSSPGHMQTFVYHDHRLAAMETMQLKSVSGCSSRRGSFAAVTGNVTVMIRGHSFTCELWMGMASSVPPTHFQCTHHTVQQGLKGEGGKLLAMPAEVIDV
jgi:hypothetical protein